MLITQLENRERELVLENREDEEKPAKRRYENAEVKALREEVSGLRDRLAGLSKRIGEARKLPLPQGGHCRDCWSKGRDAAIEEIEAE